MQLLHPTVTWWCYTKTEGKHSPSTDLHSSPL